jgi:6-phosphogluconolactonase
MGSLLYASERISNTLAAFRVDPNEGTLKTIGPFSTARQPRSSGIDASGRYLISAGQLSNTVVVHSIDKASGMLVAVGEYRVGKNPNWVEVVEIGRANAPRLR